MNGAPSIYAMCRPVGATHGCPHDGLGCIAPGKCSPPSRYAKTWADVHCVKHEQAKARAADPTDASHE